MRRTFATLAAAAAMLAPAGLMAANAGAASAATAAQAFAAPSGAGVVTQIQLANGGYAYCLDDKGRAATAGNPVILWKCSSTDSAQQWVTYPNGTIRPYDAPNLALGDSAGKAALVDPTTASANMTYDVSGLLANAKPTDAPAENAVLNDPGYKAANGVQLIFYKQSSVTSNAHWWVRKARFGTTKVSNLPDATTDPGTTYWALDNGTYKAMVLYLGDKAGSHVYQGSDMQPGTFTTFPSATTPSDKTKTLGDVNTGTMGGDYTSTFNSTGFVSKQPPATASGTGGWALVGYKSFFAAGDTSASQASGQFAYALSKDDCGNPENMTETETDNTWASSGNITAPAASSC